MRNSATIIRTFIVDYHEKLEEDYLFPRFEKMVDRVAGYDLAQFTPKS